MKTVMVVFIVCGFGFVGYLYKKKFNRQLNILNKLKDYSLYFKDNLLLFKNNLVEINFNYIIMQKNKNANNNLFIKNNDNIYQINLEVLKNEIYKESLFLTTEKYFLSQGKNEYDYEIIKINEYISVLEREISLTKEELKQKGDLYFKILLAVGVVIAILIW